MPTKSDSARWQSFAISSRSKFCKPAVARAPPRPPERPKNSGRNLPEHRCGSADRQQAPIWHATRSQFAAPRPPRNRSSARWALAHALSAAGHGTCSLALFGGDMDLPVVRTVASAMYRWRDRARSAARTQGCNRYVRRSDSRVPGARNSPGRVHARRLRFGKQQQKSAEDQHGDACIEIHIRIRHRRARIGKTHTEQVSAPCDGEKKSGRQSEIEHDVLSRGRSGSGTRESTTTTRASGTGRLYHGTPSSERNFGHVRRPDHATSLSGLRRGRQAHQNRDQETGAPGENRNPEILRHLRREFVWIWAIQAPFPSASVSPCVRAAARGSAEQAEEARRAR